MNATELAKMLEGWPEGARHPSVTGGFSPGSLCCQEGFVDKDEATTIDIDLACMSGLRWLRSQPKVREVSLRNTFDNLDHECVRITYDIADDMDEVHTFSGHPMINAIDAAIKATKG